MTTTHDPNVLPADIPAPQDDGAARHLEGLRLPALALAATDGSQVDLSKLAGRTVVYIYPRTGVPDRRRLTAGTRSPARAAARRNRARSAIISPSSSGSASRTCSGCRRRTPPISARRSSGCTCRSRCCPTPISSSTRAIELPTFTVAGMTLLKRMALVIDDGVISKVFYPVFPPDKSAEEVIAWLQAIAE